MLRYLFLFFICAFAFAQAPPVRLIGNNNPTRPGEELQFAAAGIAFNSGMQTLPSTPAVITGVTTKVQMIFCSNVTGSKGSALAATVTITDNQGIPVVYADAWNINANTGFLLMNSAVGLPMKGIRWFASADNSINCQIIGVQ